MSQLKKDNMTRHSLVQVPVEQDHTTFVLVDCPQAAQNLRKRLAADGFDTFISTLNQLTR